MTPSAKRHAPDAVLPALQDMVERACGIVLREDKLPTLGGLVRERMRAGGVEDPWQYLLDVMHGPRAADEMKRLIAELVVGETSFFRTPQQFRALQDDVLPAIAASGAAMPLRIWSAGCATGEEAYSLAITALEAFRGRAPDPVRILATDIHEAFLSTAGEGIYPEAAVATIPPLLLMKYFTVLPDGRLRVKDEVRRLVTFEAKNLADFAAGPAPEPSCAVVFCRNVMIYFRADTTRRLVARFHDALLGGGGLFLGHSETLWGISDAFRLERRSGAYYYRKPEASAAGAVPLSPAGPECPASPLPLKKIEDDLSTALSRVARAEMMADREMPAEAESACRDAVALDPGCVEALYLLCVLLRRRGELSEALSWAERAFASDARFVMAGVEAAECLALMGRKAEADALWKEIYRLLEGEVRFPRLSSASAISAKALRSYVTARLA